MNARECRTRRDTPLLSRRSAVRRWRKNRPEESNIARERGTKAPFKQTFRSLFAVSAQKVSPHGNIFARMNSFSVVPNERTSVRVYSSLFRALSLLANPFRVCALARARARGVPSFRAKTGSARCAEPRLRFRRSNAHARQSPDCTQRRHSSAQGRPRPLRPAVQRGSQGGAQGVSEIAHDSLNQRDWRFSGEEERERGKEEAGGRERALLAKQVTGGIDPFRFNLKITPFFADNQILRSTDGEAICALRIAVNC